MESLVTDIGVNVRKAVEETLAERFQQISACRDDLKSIKNDFAERLERMSTRYDDLLQQQTDIVAALRADNEAVRAEVGAVRAEHKVLQADNNSFQAADKALQEEHEALQISHQALLANFEALQARFEASQKEAENGQKAHADTSADLSTRLTSAEDALGTLHHRFAATDGHVEYLGEIAHSIRQRQDASKEASRRQQQYINTLARAIAEQTASDLDEGPQTPIQQLALDSPDRGNEGSVGYPETSPGTFRAESEVPGENLMASVGCSMAHLKRTASQSSQLLQRKRAKSNLKKAGKAWEDAQYTDDASDDMGVARPPAIFASHVLIDFSPASKLHAKEVESGMPAARVLESIAQQERLSQGGSSQQTTPSDMGPPALRRTNREYKKKEAPGMVDSGSIPMRSLRRCG